MQASAFQLYGGPFGARSASTQATRQVSACVLTPLLLAAGEGGGGGVCASAGKNDRKRTAGVALGNGPRALVPSFNGGTSCPRAN